MTVPRLRHAVLAASLFSSACGVPGADFAGAAPERVSVGRSVFDVRVRGLEAEAIRRNAEWAPRPAAVAPRALAAIEAASGCTVVRLRGDQARMLAALDCGTGPPPSPPPWTAMDCELDLYPDGRAGALYCAPRPE